MKTRKHIAQLLLPFVMLFFLQALIEKATFSQQIGGFPVVEFTTDMKFLGPDKGDATKFVAQIGDDQSGNRYWYKGTCVLNRNKDFSEIAGSVPTGNGDLNYLLWNDEGEEPEGTDGTKPLGGPGYPIDRYLEILKTDDRLGFVKVRVDSKDLKSGSLYFEIESYKVVIYQHLSTNVIRKLGPIGQGGAIPISTNKDYFFFLEAINPGKNHPQEPRDGFQRKIRARFVPPIATVPSNQSKIYDDIRVGIVDVDAVIKPSNFEGVQTYINEFIESQPEFGAWIRVNNDFSKFQSVTHDGKQKFIRDNEPDLDGLLQWNLDPDMSSYSELLLLDRPFGCAGDVTIRFPDTMVLWEIEEQANQFVPVKAESHFEKLEISNSQSISDKKFFIEAIKPSEFKAKDLVELEFVPVLQQQIGGQVETCICGKSNYSSDPKNDLVHDEAAYTAINMEVLVDGNRNGYFENDEIRDRHLLFWFNRDRESIVQSNVQRDLGNRGSDPENPQKPDCVDGTIHQTRDLEDFAGMKIILDKKLVDLHSAKGYEVETHMLDTSGPPDNSPNIRMIQIDPKAPKDAKDHIESEHKFKMNDDVWFEKRVTPLGRPYDARKDPSQNHHDLFFLRDANCTKLHEVKESANYIFEGVNVSDENLLAHGINTKVESRSYITLRNHRTKYEVSVPVELRLRDIEQFYNVVSIKATEFDKDNPEKIFFDNVDQFAPTMNDASAHNLKYPADDRIDDTNSELFELPDNQVAVLIHGWNNNQLDKTIVMETFVKRLYWQGFQGRLISFQWPAEVLDDPEQPYKTEPWNQTFDVSEFNGWRSGLSLMNFLAELNVIYGGRVHVFSHSQGAIPITEAIRLWSAGPGTHLLRSGGGRFTNTAVLNYKPGKPLIQTFIAANAAISLGTFGSNDDSLTNGEVQKLKVAVGPPDRKQIEQKIPNILDNHGLSESSLSRLLENFILAAIWRAHEVSACSDFYRFFGSGCPEQEVSGASIIHWKALEAHLNNMESIAKVTGRFYDFNPKNFKGDRFLMTKTEAAVTNKFNFFCKHDTVLGSAWRTNMSIKGIFVAHPSFPIFVYTSRVSPDGKIKIYRKRVPTVLHSFMDGRISDDLTVQNALIVGYMAIDWFDYHIGKFPIHFLADLFGIADKAAVAEAVCTDLVTMFWKEEGRLLDLGYSNPGSERCEFGKNAYEVLGLLSRSNSGSLGADKIARSDWTDVDQSTLGNTIHGIGGSYGTSTHSFFYYHTPYLTKEFYKKVVECFAGDGDDAIGSTYGED